MSALTKSVLITGCTEGGIGGALADVFHEKGYHVFATARNPSKISASLSSSANVTVLPLDVLSSDAIAAAVESVKKETGGRLDVLVNNSGRGDVAAGLDVSIEEGKKVFDLNFWAPLAMLQAFSPLLIKAKGCVVNNTSIGAYIPMGLSSIYNSSKAALVAGSETWRRELQPLGVRTITLVTCAVKTNFYAENRAVPVPETSRYYGIRDYIYDLGEGRLQDDSITPREYATKVVGEVEKGTAGTVWAGKNAFAGRLAWWLSPQWVLDKVIESIIPLSGEMSKAAQKKE